MRRLSVRHHLWLLVPIALIALTGMSQGTPNLETRVEQLEGESTDHGARIAELENQPLGRRTVVDSTGRVLGELLNHDPLAGLVLREGGAYMLMIGPDLRLPAPRLRNNPFHPTRWSGIPFATNEENSPVDEVIDEMIFPTGNCTGVAGVLSKDRKKDAPPRPRTNLGVPIAVLDFQGNAYAIAVENMCDEGLFPTNDTLSTNVLTPDGCFGRGGTIRPQDLYRLELLEADLFNKFTGPWTVVDE